MKRNSNIELLRIVSIVFILLSHFSLWSEWDTSHHGLFSYALTMIYQPLGKFGAYAFVLITSYFSVKKNIDPIEHEKKQLKHSFVTMQEVWFYSILIFVVTWALNIMQPSFENVIKALFPFISQEYWFVTAYIMLVLLIPFLNIVSVQLDFRGHLALLFTLLLFDTLSLFRNGTMSDYLASFIVVYFIGTFLRKYQDKLKPIKTWRLHATIIIIWILEMLSMVILYHMGYGSNSVHFTDKLLGFVGAAAIFLIVLRSKKFYSPIINKIAKTVFSAYLLTDNPFIRHFVWDHIFQTYKFQDQFWVPLYGLVCIALVIIVAFIVDSLRAKLFQIIKLHSISNSTNIK
ncbi:hypothetical protein AH70_02140 [Pediococcus damnosus LMG 28219]|nr:MULTISPECIES: acyltransferase family protein [Pediococcus]AMV69614.1 Hypothetical protein ADU73_1216 [Pediococcus damnosus]AVL00627.1 hypothetical protein PI20285_08255 [Pediococcus inopinatus]KJU73357.1 hypothetical protein AH70_02140 [Pediococcus damnosus LMG 28219]KRN47704.1 hypothetical protein IV84_GL001684 [Pediococcus damnosus]PIO85112.1 hypothetical protein BSQ37_03835 [Pediococcus damnosus]